MLVHLKNVVAPEQLQQLITWLANVRFEDGKLTAVGDLARSVKNNLQMTAQTPGYDQAAELLRRSMMQHKAFRLAALPQKIMPPMFSRYTSGMAYGNHYDAPVMMIGAAVMRTDISMTVFLSDPGDYDGGELVIQTEYGEQQFKGDAGDAVIYGSSFLHRVNEVTAGTRTVAVSWIQSMIRDPSKRQLLYDLAQASTTLMDEFPEREDVMAVEQTRCRLERMWYEV